MGVGKWTTVTRFWGYRDVRNLLSAEACNFRICTVICVVARVALQTKATVVGVKGSILNECHGSNYPSVRRLAMVRTDTEARSEGFAYVWIADNEAVGSRHACRMM
ncbi:hypothetical protein TNCV_2296781 [Trichonephila clavipes]|nr:hypothetical protein TNCV_2296781 [Trichonephila clavipes]